VEDVASMLGDTRRVLLLAAMDVAGRAGATGGSAAAQLATDRDLGADRSVAFKATAEVGWSRLQCDPALYMGVLGGAAGGLRGRGIDPAAEFAVGVFYAGRRDAGGGGGGRDGGGGYAVCSQVVAAAAAACRRAAKEGLDVVALRSVLAMDADQAHLLASFSPHRIAVAGAEEVGGNPTLTMAVRGRRAVSRWRAAVGADLTPQVAALSDPGCLRATLGSRVMSVSLSAAGP
jgi:nucleoside diphosphate kinase